MNKYSKCYDKDRIRLDLVSGNPNWCLALGEDGGTRITDRKLYGFGYTAYSIAVSKERLSNLIEGKEEVTFQFVDYGNKGVYLDGVRISAKGKKSDYEDYVRQKEEEKKLLKKRWSQKRYNNLYDNTWFVVKTEKIKKVINQDTN